MFTKVLSQTTETQCHGTLGARWVIGFSPEKKTMRETYDGWCIRTTVRATALGQIPSAVNSLAI
jgi:hypothetical protein